MSKGQCSVEDVLGFLSSMGIAACEIFTAGWPMDLENNFEATSGIIESDATSYVFGIHFGSPLLICVVEHRSKRKKYDEDFLAGVIAHEGLAFFVSSLDDLTDELAKEWPDDFKNHH